MAEDRMKPLRDCSKGQIGVIMTLVIVTLVGAIALCADVAVAYYNWVQLQKAADAGVLAGANYLTGNSTTTNESQVISVANTFAQANGVQASEIVKTWTWDNDGKVSMQVSRTVPYVFARLLGLTTGSVAIQATAGLNGTDAPSNLMPWGLGCTAADAKDNPGCSDLYKRGTLYKIKASQVGPGNWDPLALGGSGASTYRSNMASGYQGPGLNVGDWVSTEPGNVVGPTREGFKARLENAGDSTFVNSTPPTVINPSDPQAILVPEVDFSNINGKSQVQITGFAEMYVVGIDGTNATVSAYFIAALPNNGIASATPCKPGDALPINSCTPVLLQ
jgi:Flp pilus assembly protein TadG